MRSNSVNFLNKEVFTMAMTNTERKIKAEKELISAANEYNIAICHRDEKAMASAESACKKAMEEYNAHSLLEFFESCFKYDEEEKLIELPLVTALTKLRYQTMRYIIKEDKETGVTKCDTVYNETDVPLIAFEKYARDVKGLDSAGVNHDWIYSVEKFTQLMALYMCNELGADMKRLTDSYFVRDAARKLTLLATKWEAKKPYAVNDEFVHEEKCFRVIKTHTSDDKIVPGTEAGKEFYEQIPMCDTPTSKTQIQKLLQRVVASMVGDAYKVTSHDAAYIRSILVTKDKRNVNTVVFPTSKTVTGYIGDMLHRVIIDGKYGMKYREKK